MPPRVASLASRLPLGVGLAMALQLGGGCVHRTEPYFFANPMLAQADLNQDTEPPPTPGERPTRKAEAPPEPAAPPRVAAVRQVRAPEIREVIAPRAVADLAATRATPLPAPHRNADTAPPGVVAPQPSTPSPLQTFEGLRAWVGVRTKTVPFVQALAWHHTLRDGQLGVDGDPASPASIATLVEQAQANHTFVPAAELASTGLHVGDLLVFDRAVDDAPASLLGLVASIDARGVSEFFYVAGGVIRRGFVDPARPALVRDAERRVVNTFLRHKQNQPPAGTHFLAGELLAGAIRI